MDWGGSESTWDDTRFENEYLDKTNLIAASDIFQADIQINQLYPAAAFEDNANLLLGKTALPLASDPNPNRNSFQNTLKNCKKQKGIAANRVDYVCHSMGGCVLRTAINWFPDSYKPKNTLIGFANYDSGFVNKLITINTPHNGSPGADLITDVAPEFKWFEKSIIDSWFTKEASPFIFRSDISSSISQNINYGPGSNTMPNVITYDYEATPAVKNMRYFKTDIKTGEGVRFKETTIKNNLIAGQAAPTYQLGVDFIQDMVKELKGYKAPLAKLITRILDYKYGSKNFGKAIILSVPQIAHDFVNSIMEENYGVSSFIQSSDFVVPLSSQLPGKILSQLGNSEKLFSESRFWHIDITDQIEIGNRILEVLNQPIASDFFANKIAANTNGTQSGIVDPLQYRPSSQNTLTNSTDSLIQYIDTV